MWPFNKIVEAAEAAAVAVDPKPEPSEEKEIKIPEFGAQAHGLVQCGESWINFNDVSVIEFDPEDGCGSECRFRGSDEEWHFSDEDAAAMKAYLKGMASAGRSIEESAT
jgi:hypothetical protein